MVRSGSELMSLPEVAAYLGMAERTIYMWAQNGKVPAFKLGAAWRFRKSEIDAWLETQRTGPVVSERPYIEVDEVPPTKSEQRARSRAEKESLASACAVAIESVMLDDSRNVWILDQFIDLFGKEAVDTAIGSLAKAGSVRKSTQVDASGRKVPVIRRSN